MSKSNFGKNIYLNYKYFVKNRTQNLFAVIYVNKYELTIMEYL